MSELETLLDPAAITDQELDDFLSWLFGPLPREDKEQGTHYE